MANSISPWLSAYLIGVGEEYGGSLLSVPLFEKKKIIQVVEFLTFGSEDSGDFIWGVLSDKHYLIPARFSKEAVTEYSRLNNKRLTEVRTAVLTIKHFRPFFSRIPLGRGIKGLSRDAVLALDVGSVSVLGSIGEAQFGNPESLEKNEDLRLWSGGMRQDGGGGNVLKERKQAAGPSNVPHNKPTRLQLRSTVTNTLMQIGGAEKDESPSIPPADREHLKPDKTNPLKEYHRSWRAIAHEWKFTGKPDDVKAQLVELDEDKNNSTTPPTKRRRLNGPVKHPLDLDSSQPPEHRPEPSPHSPYPPDAIDSSSDHPISDWSITNFGSPARSREASSSPKPMEVDVTNHESPVQFRTLPPDEELGHENTFSSHLTAPTPAQRPKASDQIISLSLPLQTFPESASIPATLATDIFFSSSSFLSPSLKHPTTRRVPRPVEPPPRDPEATDPVRILVPCSDTSGTASQPHSQSQPVLPPKLPHLSPTQEHAVLSHDSLFSASDDDSQTESYDGDRSSPELAPVVSRKLVASSSSPQPGSEEEDIVDVSMVSMVTQPLEEESAKIPDEESNATESEEESPVEIEDIDNDDELNSDIDDLDEDDRKIEVEFVGPSRGASAKPNQVVRITQGDEDADEDLKFDEDNGENSKMNFDLQSSVPQMGRELNETLSMSNRLESTSSSSNSACVTPALHSVKTTPLQAAPVKQDIQSSLRKPRTLTTKSAPVILEPLPVRHDAEAWKIPSFMLSDKYKGKFKATLLKDEHTTTVHPSIKRPKVSDEVPSDKMIDLAVNKGPLARVSPSSMLHHKPLAFASGQRGIPASSTPPASVKSGQVLDPSRPQERTHLNSSRKRMRIASPQEVSDDQKRRRLVTSVEEKPTDEGDRGHNHLAPQTTPTIKTEAVEVIIEQQKLAGFSVKLDNIPCDNGALGWLGLAAILLRTGRARTRQSRV